MPEPLDLDAIEARAQRLHATGTGGMDVAEDARLLVAEVRALRATNSRLNRRAQQADWHDRMIRASDAMVLLRDFPFIGTTHAQKRSSMPLSMHGFGERAVSALHRFAERQPAAGVLLSRTEV